MITEVEFREWLEEFMDDNDLDFEDIQAAIEDMWDDDESVDPGGDD